MARKSGGEGGRESLCSTDSFARRQTSRFWQDQTKRRPHRLIFIRHGESEGNVDRNITERVPDHLLHLTMKGRSQVLNAGERLRSIVGDESIKFIVSPYVRTKETCNGILRAFADRMKGIDVREDVRIREQEFGNFDREDIKELHQEKKLYGQFYYRFPDGESPADCFDRASLFLESMYRSWQDNTFMNQVVVGHGMMILVTLMRLLRIDVDEYDHFHALANTEFVVLERPEDDGKYEITYRWAPGKEIERAEKFTHGLAKKCATGCPNPHIKIWDGNIDAPMSRPVIRKAKTSDLPSV